MALQSGVGFSKILVLAGAGYTGTILLQNGALSDLLGDLHSLLKGLEKSADQGNGDADYYEAIASQVKRLGMEVRQLASSRQITVLNGNSGQLGNMSSLLVPAAAVGAVGYGYMWWKGLKFSDLMYVTKRNMSSAVSNLTKHLERVSDTLESAKRHLTQRIDCLDGKVNEQRDISNSILHEVSGVRTELSEIGCDMDQLHKLILNADEKIGSIEYKQDLANKGIFYLCNVAEANKFKKPLQTEPGKLSGRATVGLLPAPAFPNVKSLKESLGLGNIITDLGEKPKHLIRAASIKC